MAIDWLPLLGQAGAAILKRLTSDKARVVEDVPAAAAQPEVNVLIADSKEIQEQAAKLIKGRAFGVGKKANIALQGAMVDPGSWHKKVEKKLKKYLRKDQLAAIIRAYALIRLEDEQQNLETMQAFYRAREQYYVFDSEHRSRVYNRCRSGYTKEVLYEAALDMEADDRPKAEIGSALQAGWDQSLALAPLDVYVSAESNEENLPLLVREKLLQRPIVRVFARGKKWMTVIGICETYAKANGVKVQIEHQNIGNRPSGCCRIWRPEFGENINALEREIEASLRKEFVEIAKASM